MSERGGVPVGVVVANVGALTTLAVIAAHQLGAVDHLPDPPAAIFASDLLTESKMAHPLGIPDATLGLASFGATLGLALLAGENAAARRLLAWKLLGDAAFSTIETAQGLRKYGKLCAWCLGTAVCVAGALVAGRGVIADEVKRLG